MKKHLYSISLTKHTGGSRKLREKRERTTAGFMKRKKERELLEATESTKVTNTLGPGD